MPTHVDYLTSDTPAHREITFPYLDNESDCTKAIAWPMTLAA
jgi:hypothetical protein